MFEILKRLKAIDINGDLNIILKSLEDQIIAMNTDEQLFEKGITFTGAKIVPSYADSTLKRKRRLAQPTGRVTTRDSGAYHRQFKIAFEQFQFTIIVFLELQRGFNLAEHLDKRYGDIRGLTEQNIDKLRVMIKDPLIQMIRQQL